MSHLRWILAISDLPKTLESLGIWGLQGCESVLFFLLLLCLN